jgi:hypothetical protein
MRVDLRIARFERRLYLRRVALPPAYPLALAVDTIASLGLEGRHEEQARTMRRRFEERTGAFGPDDPWFEARSRGFWDDAVTHQGFAEKVEDELPQAARPWASALRRAHRGLFHASSTMGRWLLHDIWSGAEFVVDDVDDAMRSALSAPSGPFDGRLAALSDPVRVGILPGALFHPEDAAEPIETVLRAARDQSLETHDVLDALLRMELSLRSMSRVKPGYAYRPQALAR